MCGVIAGIGGTETRGIVEKALPSIRHRGPDAEGVKKVGSVVLGHTRLAILDLDHRSDQPFALGKIVLSFNGEIWNYRELRAELEVMGRKFRTSGDTEVLAAALDEWGDAALGKLRGMFAVAWTDDGGKSLKVARDPFGEVPLHFCMSNPFVVSSEIKAFVAMGAPLAHVHMMLPGTLFHITRAKDGTLTKAVSPIHQMDPTPLEIDRPSAARRIYDLVGQGARERTISDVPVCTLLSGGIDSAAVAFHLRTQVKGLVAYTAVFNPKSSDLKMARQTAEALGLELREVVVDCPTADDLRSVVRLIEQPNKAQVEIGWACLKLAERMRGDGFKVTFSGEGSDELWASYGFAHHGIEQKGWFAFRRELFHDQHRKNFARCNKIFMAHSIECRLPFLNVDLVEFALRLPRDVVQSSKSKPKAVLQDAFASVLPPELIRRPKVAFQDGMGLKEAIAESVPDPRALYRAEHETLFGGAQ